MLANLTTVSQSSTNINNAWYSQEVSRDIADEYAVRVDVSVLLEKGVQVL